MVIKLLSSGFHLPVPLYGLWSLAFGLCSLSFVLQPSRELVKNNTKVQTKDRSETEVETRVRAAGQLHE